MTHRIPLVLVCCGSFNPITNMHLRMFGKVEFHVVLVVKIQLINDFIFARNCEGLFELEQQVQRGVGRHFASE